MGLFMLRGGFNIWPELLGFLTKNLQLECFNLDPDSNQKNTSIVENSIHTIAIIVEDCSKMFEDNKFRDVVTEMFPPICKLISTCFNETIVQNSINTINMLLLTNTEIIQTSMAEYLQVLVNIGEQIIQANTHQGKLTNMKVMWRVVQGVTAIMEMNMQAIIQQFDRIQMLMFSALMYKD